MQIINKKLDLLIPYCRNSRQHSDEQILQICSSIKEFGFTNPILIDQDNSIIAGHGRVLAAKKLKLKEVPCIVLENLSDAQKKAYIILDNKLTLNSSWDYDLLKLEFEDIQKDFDITKLGFDEKEIENIFGTEEEKEILLNEDIYQEKFEVIIECSGEYEQKKLYDEFIERGFKCRILSM